MVIHEAAEVCVSVASIKRHSNKNNVTARIFLQADFMAVACHWISIGENFIVTDPTNDMLLFALRNG